MKVQRKLPWRPDDLFNLKALIDEGKTIPDIAQAIGRSQEATRVRAALNGWYAYPSRLFRGKEPVAQSQPAKYAILYASRCLIPPSEIEASIPDLVAAAQAKNEKLGITGALLCTGTDFAQYLEGDQSAIESLMSQISADTRHKDLIVLRAGEVADLRFNGWSLAYAGLSPLVSAIIDRARRSKHANSTRGTNDLVVFLERFAGRPE